MKKEINNLIQELENEGATKQESEELYYFAKNLSNAINIERNNELKLKFLSNIQKNSDNRTFIRKHLIASVLAIIIMLTSVTLVSAQNTLPGQPLYPVKRAVENVIGVINPSYKINSLRIRSEEIKGISGNNNSPILNKAVDDYEKTLNSATDINSEKLEESRKNLEEAVKASSEEDRQILEKAIEETENKKIEVEKRGIKGIKTEQDILKNEEKED